MSRITSRLALWVLFVGMTGCQTSAPAPTIGEKQASIVHAEVDTDDPYVGSIGTCTATLIGRRTALTAATCALDEARVSFCHYPCAQIGGCAGQCVLGTVHRNPGYNGG